MGTADLTGTAWSFLDTIRYGDAAVFDFVPRLFSAYNRHVLAHHATWKAEILRGCYKRYFEKLLQDLPTLVPNKSNF